MEEEKTIKELCEAAHEVDGKLRGRCFSEALARCNSLPIDKAIQELSDRDLDDEGKTAMHFALDLDAPLELLEAMCKRADSKTPKVNLLSIATNKHLSQNDICAGFHDESSGIYPLHVAACSTTSLEVLKFCIDKYPPALLVATPGGETLLEHVRGVGDEDRAIHDEILSYLEERTRELDVPFPANPSDMDSDETSDEAFDATDPDSVEQEVAYYTKKADHYKQKADHYKQKAAHYKIKKAAANDHQKYLAPSKKAAEPAKKNDKKKK